MTVYDYGNPNAAIVLVQPVDDHDMAGLEAEVAEIQRLTDKEFRLLAVKVNDWNRDLSPWQAPAVFGNDDFGDGAKETLAGILKLCQEEGKVYYLGDIHWQLCSPFGQPTRQISLRALLQPLPPCGSRALLTTCRRAKSSVPTYT